MEILKKTWAFITASWKAVVALAIPIIWEAGVQLVDGLQGTFVDNTYALAVLTSVGVWLKANKTT